MTMLERAINNREVITYVNGQPTPYNKRSNLYKAIHEEGYTLDDLEAGRISIAIGAHRRNYSDGFKMAIVKN